MDGILLIRTDIGCVDRCRYGTVDLLMVGSKAKNTSLNTVD